MLEVISLICLLPPPAFAPPLQVQSLGCTTRVRLCQRCTVLCRCPLAKLNAFQLSAADAEGAIRSASIRAACNSTGMDASSDHPA